MKKTISLLFLFAFTAQVFAQKIKLPENRDFGIPMVGVVGENDADTREGYDRLHTYDYDSLDDVSKWRYNMREATFRHFLEMDSATYYLDLAYEARPRSTCSIFINSDEIMKRRKEDGLLVDKEYFLWGLPYEYTQNFKSRCKDYFSKHNIVPKEKPERAPSNLEKRIMAMDQTGRLKRPHDWDEIGRTDLINRILLDSIYSARGTLQGLDTYEMDAFSMVLHHSADCEWNFKWFNIWFEEIKKSQDPMGGKMLRFAFERMFHIREGTCREKMPEETQLFLDETKKNVHPAILERYGIDYFLYNER